MEPLSIIHLAEKKGQRSFSSLQDPFFLFWSFWSHDLLKQSWCLMFHSNLMVMFIFFDCFFFPPELQTPQEAVQEDELRWSHWVAPRAWRQEGRQLLLRVWRGDDCTRHTHTPNRISNAHVFLQMGDCQQSSHKSQKNSVTIYYYPSFFNYNQTWPI